MLNPQGKGGLLLAADFVQCILDIVNSSGQNTLVMYIKYLFMHALF